jgi:hypothetical protein
MLRRASAGRCHGRSRRSATAHRWNRQPLLQSCRCCFCTTVSTGVPSRQRWRVGLDQSCDTCSIIIREGTPSQDPQILIIARLSAPRRATVRQERVRTRIDSRSPAPARLPISLDRLDPEILCTHVVDQLDYAPKQLRLQGNRHPRRRGSISLTKKSTPTS